MGVLHHRDMELARQQQDGAHGEQRHRHPAAALQSAAEHLDTAGAAATRSSSGPMPPISQKVAKTPTARKARA
jgi:hypothetical protein